MRLRTTLSTAFIVATTSVAVALSACGGSQPTAQNATATTGASSAPATTDTTAATTTTAPTDTGTASATASTTASAPSTGSAWDAMSHDQKMDLMKNTVFPKMKADFQAFNATDYANFTCKTCHGAGAKDGTFKMPNPDLPKLDVAHGFAKDKAAHPDAMTFMMAKVKPEMAQMLGEAEYSQTNQNGFGCMECHTAAP